MVAELLNVDESVLVEETAMFDTELNVEVVGMGFVDDGSEEKLEDAATTLEDVDGVEDADGWENVTRTEVLEDGLEAAGAETTTVTGGELTSMIEYFVAVVVAVAATGVWVMVTKTVCVDFGPSIIFVDTTTLVTGGNVTLSVSTIVTGAGVWIIVFTIVGSGDPSLVAAGPPSTGTTE